MTSKHSDCQFCTLPDERVWLGDKQTIAFRDAYPISKGHTLVIPRLHVESMFKAPTEIQSALWSAVARIRSMLEEEFEPSGFNVGVNDGQAAGQTIAHAHIHVIPRYEGDIDDPRGGIRWVIPGKAVYWE